MKNKKNSNKGFIRLIILVIAALVLLKYFYDINVIGYLAEGRFRDLAEALWGVIIKIWNYAFNWIK